MTTAVLVASVVLRLYPVPSLAIYFDEPPGEHRRVEAAVQEAACPYVRAQAVPLPVPYKVYLFKRTGESLAYVPVEHGHEGLLMECKP